MAPHKEEILFDASDTLYDLLSRSASYVPSMRNFEWKIMCDAEILGRLVSGSEAEYKCVPEKADIKISELSKYEVFCRNIFCRF